MSQFPIVASNREVDGLAWQNEAVWAGPFYFVQAADTQFGMMANFNNRTAEPSWQQEILLTTKLIEKVNVLEPRPRFMVICGDLVDALPNVAYKPDQIRDLKEVLQKLHPDIIPLCVCGNHDIGDIPTPESIKQYITDFGDDFYEFWVGGVQFITVNSQFYHDDSFTKQLHEEHDSWLEKTLRDKPGRTPVHKIVLQHIPPFVSHRDEEPVDVPGNDELKFNIADKKTRFNFLDILKKHGVSKVFCGHYHRNAGGWDQNLEVIVTSAVGQQLGDDGHGARIVTVSRDSIKHTYHRIDQFPTKVQL